MGINAENIVEFRHCYFAAGGFLHQEFDVMIHIIYAFYNDKRDQSVFGLLLEVIRIFVDLVDSAFRHKRFEYVVFFFRLNCIANHFVGRIGFNKVFQAIQGIYVVFENTLFYVILKVDFVY